MTSWPGCHLLTRCPLYLFSCILDLGVMLYEYNTNFSVQGSVHRKYIPIYIQQDATLHSLFISGNYSTRFGLYLHQSSGAHNCMYSIWYLSNRYCYLPLSWKSWKWTDTLRHSRFSYRFLLKIQVFGTLNRVVTVSDVSKAL